MIGHCVGASTDVRCKVGLQDWLHSEDEFSIALKVNYILEDLLPVTVTSCFILCLNRKLVNFNFKWIFENLNFWFSDHSDIGVR